MKRGLLLPNRDLVRAHALLVLLAFASHSPYGKAVEFSIPGSTAIVIPGYYPGVTTDLFDVANGLDIKASTSALSSSYPVRQMFGSVGSGNEPGHTLFASVGNGNAATVTYEMSRPVLVDSIALGLGQDYSNTFRGVAAFQLEGVDAITGQTTLLSAGTLAGNYVTAYGDGAIAVTQTLAVPYYGARYRFSAVQRNGGLRVMELDGFGVVPQEINIVGGQASQTALGLPTLNQSWEYVKVGKGTVNLDQGIAYSRRLHILEGGVSLLNPRSLALGNVSVFGSGMLSVASASPTTVRGLTLMPGGVVDLMSGALTITAGWTAELATSELKKGRGDGSWNGRSGVTSSAAALSNGTRVVGWIASPDGSLTLGYASPGDTNLDWNVDILDAANLLGSGKINSGLTATWAEGDFNYDGFTDILDVADFVSSGLFNVGPYNSPSGSIAAVPEPSTYVMALAGVACGGYLRFRRRKQA